MMRKISAATAWPRAYERSVFSVSHLDRTSIISTACDALMKPQRRVGSRSNDEWSVTEIDKFPVAVGDISMKLPVLSSSALYIGSNIVAVIRWRLGTTSVSGAEASPEVYEGHVDGYIKGSDVVPPPNRDEQRLSRIEIKDRL
jgi:hypothetical protein